MKINIKDEELFIENNLNLNGTKVGIITDNTIKRTSNYDMKYEMYENTLECSLEDINKLNFILNDDNCSDTFINNICNKLNQDGIKYELVRSGEGINRDNFVIITLDQQYTSGPGITILAPFDNHRFGNSDALIMASNASFLEQKLPIDDILCGKAGFRKDIDSDKVLTRIPTKTEEIIDKTSNTSFANICFGTNSISADVVALCIENTLARYSYYINNVNDKIDLIYRDENNETIINDECKDIMCFKSNVSVNIKNEISKTL